MKINASRVSRAIAGAALAAGVGGCSMLGWEQKNNSAPSAYTPTVMPDPSTSPEVAAGWSIPRVRSARGVLPVNVFGEMGIARTRPTMGGNEHGFQQHTATDEGVDADVVLDPSGKWIAFSSTRHSEKADIYLQRTDGLAVIQLTTDPGDDVQPVFSPDGTKIAFASTRGGNWDIYVMDFDGKNVRQVTQTVAQELHPSFSADGNRLAFCSLSARSEQWEIWTVNLDSAERKMIGNGLFPSWSPDKSVDRIAFQRARQRGTRWFSLWTVDLVEGEPKRLTEVAVSTNAAVVCPSWSPDGKKLAFATILLPAGTGPERVNGKQDVWVVNADGTGRHRVTEGVATNIAPYWGVNNRVYFISDRGGRENIWSVKIDGSETATASKEVVDEHPKEHTEVQPRQETGHAGATEKKEAGHAGVQDKKEPVKEHKEHHAETPPAAAEKTPAVGTTHEPH